MTIMLAIVEMAVAEIVMIAVLVMVAEVVLQVAAGRMMKFVMKTI